MRIAIVADWLTTIGGAERVIAELLSLYPQATLFATVAKPGLPPPIGARAIRTSRLQRWYRLIGRHEPLLPWMPRAVEELDLRGFDVVLSSSHAVAKGVVPPPTARHICYCHTPARYAWEMERQYLKDFRIPSMLQPRIRTMLRGVRRWDLTSAKRVDRFLANSTTTQERIKRIYGRESTVVPPPVEDRFFSAPLSAATDDAPYLALGRLVPYKRFDVLIAVANARGVPLHIAGDGVDAARLRRLAGPTVRFLGRVADADLPAIYATARAVLLPQLEDAGIVPREALASGTPCIAFGEGGVLDAVHDGQNGILFDAQTVDAIDAALRRFEECAWDREAIRASAEPFMRSHFHSAVRAAVGAAQHAG